ncbi:MAG: PAS domain-containing protein, partial [Pseudomonadota bacterium]
NLAHIYRRRSIRRSEHAAFSETRSLPKSRNLIPVESVQPETTSTDRQMFEALALGLGKNSILVTSEYSIVRVYGDVSPYIEMNESSNLKMHIDLLRRPFREEARSLVTLSLKNAEQRSGVRHLLAEDADAEVRLEVYPIIARDINERAALVVFSEVKRDITKEIGAANDNSEAGIDSDRIRLLEDEVATTREALQQTIEELETSNEELQSLNEELQSTNEELQATNEELETSNEELQSTNEELITVNEELQVTAAELSGRTGELMSVLETAPLSIMVLDTALQISQATNAASEMFALTRPISNPHISQCVLPEGFPTLAPICNETLKLGEPISNEFNAGGSRCKLTCSPFFDMRGQMKGVTIVVSEFPGLAQELDLILDDLGVYMINRDTDGTILRISEKMANSFGTTRHKAEGAKFSGIAPKAFVKAVRARDTVLLKSEEQRVTETIEYEPASGESTLWLSAESHLFRDPVTEKASIYTIAQDITGEIETRLQAEDSYAQLLMLQDMAEIGYWSLELQTERLFWSDQVHRIHGTDPTSFQPRYHDALNFYHEDDREMVGRHVSRVMEQGGDFHFKARLVQNAGTIVPVEAFGLARKKGDGTIHKVIGAFRKVD